MKIVEYQPKLAQHFDQINRDWIEKYFVIEQRDNMDLRNPEQQIIKPGGAILFAKEGENILGTVALKKHSDDIIELTKMGVYESARNNGIGKYLISAALEKAKKLGYRTIILCSNRQLKNAIHLYKKFGFKEMEISKAHNEYERCDIQMEMSLY